MIQQLTYEVKFTLAQDDHFPFINCVETRVYEGKYSQWDTCFKELSLDPKPVTSCYKGEEGKKVLSAFFRPEVIIVSC